MTRSHGRPGRTVKPSLALARGGYGRSSIAKKSGYVVTNHDWGVTVLPHASVRTKCLAARWRAASVRQPNSFESELHRGLVGLRA